MRKRFYLFLLSGLAIQMILGNPAYTQILGPADIMEKYGKAVVLIVGIKNGEEVGLGSGFIVKSSGVIVTNYHVMQGSYPALVKTKGGDIYEDISVIDFNARQDIAIIKIKGFDLPTVTLGNSNSIRVGERVVVIGNPHGYENTISDGLLSQVRDTEQGYFLHQISAPISGGSSGSPVFNMRGEVIGIATLSDTLGQNLNFSVPINYARGMIDSPAKYSLKEFVAIKPETSFLSENEKALSTKSNKALKILNDALTSLYYGADENTAGFQDMMDQNAFNSTPNKYLISPKFYYVNQLIKASYNDLQSISSTDLVVQDIKESLLRALSKAIEATDALIEALETRNINRIMSAAAGYSIVWNYATTELTIKFVDKIRKDYPSLEPDLPGGALLLEEYKKWTPEQIAESQKKGIMGITSRQAARLPVVLSVEAEGGAFKAGIKRDDIIIAVKNSPDFSSVVDFARYLITVKSGWEITFNIIRAGQRLERAIRFK